MSKKVKIFSIILIVFAFILTSNNTAYAKSIVGSSGVDSMISDFINNTNGTTSETAHFLEEYMNNNTLVSIGLDDMQNSTNIYCAEDYQHMNKKRAQYKITHYIEIDGYFARGYYINDKGNIIMATSNSRTNAVFAEILSGTNFNNNDFGYGKFNPDNEYGDQTDRQIGVWLYVWSFLNENSSKFNIDMYSWGTATLAGRESESGKQFRYDAQQHVANGAQPRVKILLLEDVTAGDWQNLIITIREEEPPTDDKQSQITIKKVNENNVNMSNVAFIIEKIENNIVKYLSSYSINSDGIGQVTFSNNASDAQEFWTNGGNVENGSGYSDIVIKGLPAGNYIIKEIKNKNPGYEKNGRWTVDSNGNVTYAEDWTTGNNNPSTEITVQLQTNATITRTMKNTHTPTPGSTTSEGYITIKGYVWQEQFGGKSNSNNNVKDPNEKGVPGVRVRWRKVYSDGTDVILGETTTNSDGLYVLTGDGNIARQYNVDTQRYMYVELWDHPANTTSPYTDRFGELNNGTYIEFTYNGQKYTTVAPYVGNNQATQSKGIEVSGDRALLDSMYDKISNKGVIDGSSNTPLTYNRSKDPNNNDLTISKVNS